MYKYLPWLLVVLVSLLLSFLYIPPYDIYFDDKEIFKYIGFLINKGKVPYKDFFDHKPPMIFFLNSLGQLLGQWGFWIFDTILVQGVSLLFLKVNIKYGIAYPAILPIVFNLILRNNTISFGIGMTREYTTILLLTAYCCILLRSHYKYVYLGLLSSLIFFFQQEQIILLIPFILYSLWFDSLQRRNVIKNVLDICLGFMVVIVPILLYFVYNGALKNFWQSAFLFNYQWYTNENKPSLVREVIVIKNYIYDLKFDIAFLLALTAGFVSLIIGNKRKILMVITLLTVLLSFISEFLSGKLAIGNAVLIYYFLPLAATLPFCLFVAFVFTKDGTFKYRPHQFIYSCLLVVNLVLNIIVYVANYHKYPNRSIANSPTMKYLEQHQPGNYDLYIFNESNYTYAYNKFQILTPSKWIYHFFWEWYPDWDRDGQKLKTIISDLQKHQTKYIIYNPDSNKLQQFGNLRLWHQFLFTFYFRVDNLPVWVRKRT